MPVTALAGSAMGMAEQNFAAIIAVMEQMTEHMAQTEVRQDPVAVAAVEREAARQARREEPAEDRWIRFVTANAGPWRVGITEARSWSHSMRCTGRCSRTSARRTLQG